METSLKRATLKKVIVHYVGSKNNLDPLQLSEKEVQISEEDKELIGAAFLSKFNHSFETYRFTHPSSLQFNEVYNYASELFLKGETFSEQSKKMAKHLYESSTHPKVKSGELYVCFFEGLPVEGRVHSAIGLFKTEHKTHFLNVSQKDKVLELQLKEGVDISKPDKGCLIINLKKEDGFDVLIFDNQARGDEAAYWKEKFLGLEPQKTNFHQTNHLLSLTKQYITGALEEGFGVEKKEQVELLSKSINYIKSNETFDISEFQSEVFGDEERIESFRNFGSLYIKKHDFDITSNFDISLQAVQKQSRVFKSVLKLDRNFHIYIHGNTDLIEKGTDDDGRKFYKIYYNQET